MIFSVSTSAKFDHFEVPLNKHPQISFRRLQVPPRRPLIQGIISELALAISLRRFQHRKRALRSLSVGDISIFIRMTVTRWVCIR